MTTTPKITRRATAAQALAAIRANVDAWNAHAITWDVFGENQRALWDAIVARGDRFHARVLAHWRHETYGAA
jgi:hypothetical protein